MDIFNIEDYKYIGKMIESKTSILRKNEDFNQKYLKLFDSIDKLEKNLSEEQKNQFNEILNLFYQTEEYYYTLSYSLGLKYGEDLKKI